MQTFRRLDDHLGLVPAQVVNSLGEIDRCLGRQEIFMKQNPAALETLIKIARIQSTEASNAIEEITAPSARIRELVEEKTTPENRSEAEIAGYRKVLDQIHASAPHIPFKRTIVEQFHRDLYSFTATPGGRFKIGPNDVKEFDDQGHVIRVRFQPMGVAETPSAMDELHEGFEAAVATAHHHRLLLIGAYVFDFLMIHPFQDGNGRMSRLLTLLALYHGGYEVGRYISIEKIINDSRETYYESLERSTAGWHDSQHDIWPWLSFFTGVMIAAYTQFESRVDSLSRKGSKAELVRSFVRGLSRDEFTLAEVRGACPGVGDDHLRGVLRKMKKGGIVTSEGTGKAAKWIRLSTDF